MTCNRLLLAMAAGTWAHMPTHLMDLSVLQTSQTQLSCRVRPVGHMSHGTPCNSWSCDTGCKLPHSDKIYACPVTTRETETNCMRQQKLISCRRLLHNPHLLLADVAGEFPPRRRDVVNSIDRFQEDGVGEDNFGYPDSADYMSPPSVVSLPHR